LEDQVFPKRCGHLDGKAVIPAQDMVEKIRRAKKVAKDPHGFVICARTDARGVEGFDCAVERARRYVVEGGADMIFPEGLSTLEEFADFARHMRAIGDLGLAPQGGPFLLAKRGHIARPQQPELLHSKCILC
jgi:methylisocitrate lyase